MVGDKSPWGLTAECQRGGGPTGLYRRPGHAQITGLGIHVMWVPGFETAEIELNVPERALIGVLRVCARPQHSMVFCSNSGALRDTASKNAVVTRLFAK